VEKKIKQTLDLLASDTFIKQDAIHAIKQAAAKFADGHTEENVIATTIYERLFR